MKKVKWEFKGMIPMGDKDGPIYKWTAVVDGHQIEKLTPMRAKTLFYTSEGRFSTLAAALNSLR